MFHNLLTATFLLCSTLSILTSAAPVLNTPVAGSSITATSTGDLFYISRNSPLNNLIPRATDPLTHEQWLTTLKSFNVAADSVCQPRLNDTKICSFVTHSYENQLRAEWFLYNNKCERLQHWIGEDFPHTYSPIRSTLPYKTLISQQAADQIPVVQYLQRVSSEASCFNGGISAIAPFFRLKCKVEFDCSSATAVARSTLEEIRS